MKIDCAEMWKSATRTIASAMVYFITRWCVGKWFDDGANRQIDEGTNRQIGEELLRFIDKTLDKDCWEEPYHHRIKDLRAMVRYHLKY